MINRIHDDSDPEKKKKRWKLDAELLSKDLERNPSNTRTVFYLAQVLDSRE